MADIIQIQAQIAALKKQAESIRHKEFAATIAEIRSKMTAFGITIKDIQSERVKLKVQGPAKIKRTKTHKGTKVTSKVQAKYKGPNGETWSGRGLTPKWLNQLISQGRRKDQFLIDFPLTSS